MQSQPVCPCCHSAQSSQRVAAIVSGGTRQIRVLTADLVPARGVVCSNLAQLLAPPRRPSSGCLVVLLFFGLLLLSFPASWLATGVIFELQGQNFDTALASGAVARIFNIVGSVAALASIALTVGVAQLAAR